MDETIAKASLLLGKFDFLSTDNYKINVSVCRVENRGSIRCAFNEDINCDLYSGFKSWSIGDWSEFFEKNSEKNDHHENLEEVVYIKISFEFRYPITDARFAHQDNYDVESYHLDNFEKIYVHHKIAANHPDYTEEFRIPKGIEMSKFNDLIDFSSYARRHTIS